MAALLGLGSGCGLTVEANYQRLRPSLLARQYRQALADIDREKDAFYGGKNRLLYLMDRAMVLHLAGNFVESSRVVEEAKALSQRLWTTSVREGVLAAVGTDQAFSYQGEDFERVMLHLLRALNDLGRGDLAEARVEARQLTASLSLINAAYGDHPNAYSDDAFARWLAARLGETDAEAGAANEAWIDYRRALALYRRDGPRYQTPVPRLLVADAARVLERLGDDFAEDRAAFWRDFGPVAAPRSHGVEAGGVATLVFIHLSGEVPRKVDDVTTVWLGPEPLRIAVPRFVPTPARIRAARVRVPGAGAEATTEKAADIARVAVENLADHIDRIRARAVARASIKYAAGAAAQVAGRREGGQTGFLLELGGALWNIGNALAEEADKRSWITLPAEIGICALDLPPGSHRLEIDFVGADGLAIEREVVEVSLRPAATTFVSRRTLQ